MTEHKSMGTDPKNIEYLREHGPTPGPELPGQRKPKHRARGIRILRVSGTSAQTETGERMKSIYYFDEHDPVAVIETFCEAHPELTARVSKERFTRMFGNHGREWKAAARQIAEDRDLESHTANGSAFDADDERICPACGEDVDVPLPTHLRQDCAENL